MQKEFPLVSALGWQFEAMGAMSSEIPTRIALERGLSGSSAVLTQGQCPRRHPRFLIS